MKRIIIFLTIFAATTTFQLRAQDVAALEERVKQLNGYVQDLIEDKANQKKQIEALSKEIQALREHQQNQPKTTYASQEDLRALAKQVQEIEANRKTDREVILKEIDKLGRASGSGVGSKPPKPPKNPSTTTDNPGAGNLPDKAIEHTIAAGDTLSTIAVAYNKEKGLKLTSDLILKANPGLDAKKLKIGQTILVPVVEK